MPSHECFEVKIDRTKLARCRKLAAESCAGFVCGPWKLQQVIDRRAWKFYRNMK